MEPNKKKAYVALSGGVDSSVCAMLLKKQGYEVVGITGKMTKMPFSDTVCENASRVAQKIGIEHVSLDVSDYFDEKVVNYFINSYKIGETPNPCIMCNKFIKWGKIFDYAFDNGADVFATGHYANIIEKDGIFKLYPALDEHKDQLYFLFELNQAQLSKTIFPLSGYKKGEIRQFAQEYNLPSKSSKESQDICFIQKPMSAKKYLKEHIISKKGDFISVRSGKKVGEHDGFFQFTIGQRKGIGIAAEEPYYVIGIDGEKNIVYLGFGEDTYGKEVILKNFNFSYPILNTNFHAKVKIRYNMGFENVEVWVLDDKTVKLVFENEISAITKGQAGVLYDVDDGHLLGGGWVV